MAESHVLREKYNRGRQNRVIILTIQKRKEQDFAIYIIIARDRSSYVTSDIVEFRLKTML